MSDTITPDPDAGAREAPEPKRRWRPRPLHWHLSIWSLVSILLASIFIVLASMSLTGRVIVLPDWVSERVLVRLNAAVPSGSFTLRQIEFGMTPAGRPRIRLVDLGIRDSTGLDIAQLNGVEGGLRIGAALAGRLEPTVLKLQGAQMTLRRLSNGTFALSLGQDTGTSGNLASMLDSIDAAFTDGPLSTVSKVVASDMTITLEDARSGRLWQVTDGRMQITPGEKVVDTVVSFDVFNQTEELATTEFSFRSARDSSEASLAARFSNAAAGDIAAQTPALAFLSVIDAPISGALRSTIDADGAISELAGTMEIGSGALSPAPGAKPAKFDGAKIYIDYDPTAQRLDFQGLSVRSELGTVLAEGAVYMTDIRNGWPNSLIGQVTIDKAELNPPGIFEHPLSFDSGVADLRVKLDPFSIDIGQAVVNRGPHRYQSTGRLSAGADGWRIAMDATFENASRDEILALWPLSVNSGGRNWMLEHVHEGEAFGASLSWRNKAGEAPVMTGTLNMRDVRVTLDKAMPDINLASGYYTLTRKSFSITAESASIVAPDGSLMDLSGTTYQLPEMQAKPPLAVVRLAMTGPLRGALSLLDKPPFSIFSKSDFGPDMARGEAVITGRIDFPLHPYPTPAEEYEYDIHAELTDVTSDVVIEGKLFASDALSLDASQDGIEISGPVAVGQAMARGTWRMPLDAGKPGDASAEGTIEISQRSLAEFGLGALEDMVSGAARGQFTLDLAGGQPPELTLRSNLAGLDLNIPGTGWSKRPTVTGALDITAHLGDRPVVDALSISAPGLSAQGSVTSAEGGTLGEARFDRVKIGGWLDAPVVLTGRGANRPIAITLPGGTIDMRKAELDTGKGGGSGAAGPSMPLTLELDRLIVSEGIQIRNLRGDFELAGGMHGTFSGRIGKGTRLRGTMAQAAEGAAFRITSKDAGGVLQGAGVFQTARDGDLELILAPVAGEGTYEGEFSIKDTRIIDAPAMAELLSAVSVIGLLEQLRGDGIHFADIQGRFRLSPDTMTLYRSSATGASMGISMDGYYDLTKGEVDFQGVLSPFYILNSFGRIFSPRDGEGLVGFNFTLKGAYSDPKVEINPLSILTPGVFREIFRRPPPTEPEPEQ